MKILFLIPISAATSKEGLSLPLGSLSLVTETEKTMDSFFT